MIGSEEEADHMTDNGAPVYRRVLLKLSGEALMGDLEYGIDPQRVQDIASEVAAVHARGVCARRSLIAGVAKWQTHRT